MGRRLHSRDDPIDRNRSQAAAAAKASFEVPDQWLSKPYYIWRNQAPQLSQMVLGVSHCSPRPVVADRADGWKALLDLHHSAAARAMVKGIDVLGHRTNSSPSRPRAARQVTRVRLAGAHHVGARYHPHTVSIPLESATVARSSAVVPPQPRRSAVRTPLSAEILRR